MRLPVFFDNPAAVRYDGKIMLESRLHKTRIKYITAVVLYGTIGMFLRHVSLPSELVAMCRGSIGFVFLLLFLRAGKIAIDREAIRNNRRLLLISGILLGLNWIFLFAAYMHTTVAIASLCNYTAPVIVVLVAPLLLKERTPVKKLAFLFLAFFGIVLVSGVTDGGDVNLFGVFMGFAAALMFTCIVLCNRSMKEIGPYEKALVQLPVSAVTILPWFLFHNRGVALAVDVRSILIVLMLGIVHTGFAYCLYFDGMSNLPVQEVAVLGYLEPVVSVLCSAFFLQEPLSFAGWIGAALVILSSLLCEVIPDTMSSG